jgi:hypothetical protein
MPALVGAAASLIEDAPMLTQQDVETYDSDLI